MFTQMVGTIFTDADIIFLKTSGLLVFGYIGMLWSVKFINFLISLYQKECENQILDIYPVWKDDNAIAGGYRLEEQDAKLYQVTIEIDSRESFFQSYKQLGRSSYSKVLTTLSKFFMAFSWSGFVKKGMSECKEYFSVLLIPSWNSLYVILSHIIHVQFFRTIPYTGNEFIWMCLGLLISGSYYLSMEYLIFRNHETSDLKSSVIKEFYKVVLIIVTAVLMSRYFLINTVTGFEGEQYRLYFSIFIRCCFCTIGAACFCIFFIRLSRKIDFTLKKQIKHLSTLLLIIYPIDLLLREVFYIDFFNIPLYEFPLTGYLMAPFIRTYVVLSESMVALVCIYMFYTVLVWTGIKFLLSKASGLKERIKKLIMFFMKIPRYLFKGFIQIGNVMLHICEFAFKVMLYILEFCFNTLCAIKEQFLNDLISYYRKICAFFCWSYRFICNFPEMVYTASIFLGKTLLNSFLFIGQLPSLILGLIYKLFLRLVREFKKLVIDIKTLFNNLNAWTKKLLSLVFYSLPMLILSFTKSVFSGIKEYFSTFLQRIHDFISNFPELMKELLVRIKELVSAVFIKLPMMIMFCVKSAVMFILNCVSDFFREVWNLIIILPEKIYLLIASVFSNFGKFFESIVVGFMNLIKLVLTMFVNVITSIQKMFIAILDLPRKLFIALCKEGVMGLIKALYFNTVEVLFKMFYSATHKG